MDFKKTVFCFRQACFVLGNVLVTLQKCGRSFRAISKLQFFSDENLRYLVVQRSPVESIKVPVPSSITSLGVKIKLLIIFQFCDLKIQRRRSTNDSNQLLNTQSCQEVRFRLFLCRFQVTIFYDFYCKITNVVVNFGWCSF